MAARAAAGSLQTARGVLTSHVPGAHAKMAVCDSGVLNAGAALIMPAFAIAKHQGCCPMSLESEKSSDGLAALVVDALQHAGIVSQADFERAMAIAIEEIEVRKAVGDYWCAQCPLAQTGESHGDRERTGN